MKKTHLKKTTLDECNEDIMYASIYRFLIILASLPVNTETSERLFSTLRRMEAI